MCIRDRLIVTHSLIVVLLPIVHSESSPSNFKSCGIAEMTDPGYIKQLFPILAPSIIVTLEPTQVPSPISTLGPIIEYLKNWAPEHGNTLCFVGYQASGTLGRRLQEGHSHVPVVDSGQTLMIDVNCNLVIIDGFSGHSDTNQLIDYVGALNPTPRKIICHHGDVISAQNDDIDNNKGFLFMPIH